jgi:hypothetical protein
MSDARREAEFTEALEEVRVTLAVLVAHAGVQDEVEAALAAKRENVERSRLEIKRSFGRDQDPDDARR